MNYPLISEYIEAIKSAEENFKELSSLRPVFDDDDEPVMASGGHIVKVEKTRLDATPKKHIWKILSVYCPMYSGVENSEQ